MSSLVFPFLLWCFLLKHLVDLSCRVRGLLPPPSPESAMFVISSDRSWWVGHLDRFWSAVLTCITEVLLSSKWLSLHSSLMARLGMILIHFLSWYQQAGLEASICTGVGDTHFPIGQIKLLIVAVYVSPTSCFNRGCKWMFFRLAFWNSDIRCLCVKNLFFLGCVWTFCWRSTVSHAPSLCLPSVITYLVLAKILRFGIYWHGSNSFITWLLTPGIAVTRSGWVYTSDTQHVSQQRQRQPTDDPADEYRRRGLLISVAMNVYAWHVHGFVPAAFPTAVASNVAYIVSPSQGEAGFLLVHSELCATMSIVMFAPTFQPRQGWVFVLN